MVNLSIQSRFLFSSFLPIPTMLRNARIFTCIVVPFIEIDPTYALDNSCYKTFFVFFAHNNAQFHYKFKLIMIRFGVKTMQTHTKAAQIETKIENTMTIINYSFHSELNIKAIQIWIYCAPRAKCWLYLLAIQIR